MNVQAKASAVRSRPRKLPAIHSAPPTKSAEREPAGELGRGEPGEQREDERAARPGGAALEQRAEGRRR